MPNEQQIRQIVQDELSKTGNTGTFSGFQVNKHTHNGFDSPPVSFSDLANNQFSVSSHIQGTSAATATNYGAFWIAPFACSVQTMWESHGNPGSDAGDVSLLFLILSPGQTFLSTPFYEITSFSLKTPANVPGFEPLRQGAAPAILKAGDRLALTTSGVLTNVADVTVTVVLEYL